MPKGLKKFIRIGCPTPSRAHCRKEARKDRPLGLLLAPHLSRLGGIIGRSEYQNIANLPLPCVYGASESSRIQAILIEGEKHENKPTIRKKREAEGSIPSRLG